MSPFETLIRRIAELERRIEDVDRQVQGTLTEGVVKSIDTENATATVEAQGVLTKDVPWLSRAGAVSEWSPPTVGERVLLANPGGDIGRAMILPGGYSDDNPAPHDTGGEFVRVTGDVRVEQTGSTLKITAAGVTVTISGSGLKVEGGLVEHDDKNIGKTHKHGGVVAGGDITDVPV